MFTKVDKVVIVVYTILLAVWLGACPPPRPSFPTSPPCRGNQIFIEDKGCHCADTIPIWDEGKQKCVPISGIARP